MNQTIRKRIEDINNGIVPEGYKQTPFGIFPCDWGKKELLSFCSCITKGTTPKTFADNGIKFVKVESIKDVYVENDWCSFIDESTHQGFLARSILEANDILFTIAGATIGKCAIVRECNLPANTNQALSIIRLKDKKLKWYIFSQLRGIAMKRYVKDCISVGAQPNISLEQLGKFSFYSCILKEENIKIAEILMKWDEAVELQEQYIQKLELRKKSIMKKLLTPKDGWKSVKLGDMAEMYAGGTPSTKNLEYWGGDIPWIQSGLIQNNYIEIKDINGRITEKGLKNSSTAWIEKDSVLVAITGATCANIAYLKCKATANQSVISITTNKINSCFLYFYMQNARNELLALQNGSAQGGLTLKYLQNFEIQYPENQEQEKISQILFMVDEEISLQKEKLAKIKEQRKAMQQYLLTGIVRV